MVTLNRQEKNKYILWLPKWYPSEIDALNGDFIQRHAQAVSPFLPVKVIFIIRDDKGSVTRSVAITSESKKNLEERRLYYFSPTIFFKPLEKALSFTRYIFLYLTAINNMIKECGVPSAVHVHIYGKNALLALLLKIRYGIPVYYSEQNTFWLPQAHPGVQEAGWLFKKTFALFLRRVNRYSVVSRYLGDAIGAIAGRKDYVCIPNVVDGNLFYPEERPNTSGNCRFIHVSTLARMKNFDDILTAFAKVKDSHPHFSLNVYGPGAEQYIQTVERLGLSQHVRFFGPVSHTEVAQAMRSSDAFVLYSRYETFGCVVIEANASGLPVIVSDVKPMNELVEEGKNGYLVRGEDPEGLAQKIISFMTNNNRPDKSSLHADTIGKYAPDAIGLSFLHFYGCSEGDLV